MILSVIIKKIAVDRKINYVISLKENNFKQRYIFYSYSNFYYIKFANSIKDFLDIQNILTLSYILNLAYSIIKTKFRWSAQVCKRFKGKSTREENCNIFLFR